MREEASPAVRPSVSRRARWALGAAVVVLGAGPIVWTSFALGPVPVIAACALFSLLVIVTGSYMRRFEPAVWADVRLLGVTATLLLGMMYLTVGTRVLLPDVTPYVMPVPLAAMIAAQMSGPRLGLIVSVLTAAAGLLLGFADGVEIVAAFLASVGALVVFSSLIQRRQLVRAGLHVMVTVGVASLLAAIVQGAHPGGALVAGGQGVLGGATAAVLAYGLLPFFENIFGLTTDIRLLELSSPSSPLMRQLMQSAPGTYAHSLLTGNLAETAAEAIGADQLLARVGAYYHDIGKLRRPSFFSENLDGAANPHDETSPSLSALIITAHVREGMELAREHRLPPELSAIIRQHHGDSLVSYFYRKAAAGTDGVFEGDFRYGGERPTSKEAALVMLADCVEAAVRSLAAPSTPRIEATVRRVVEDKVADGQLRDSTMTLSDIEHVIEVYARILGNIHHSRVEYPDEARSAIDASQRHESPRA